MASAEYMREWRSSNLERAREIARESYARNRDAVKARAAAYRAEHRAERLAQRRVAERGDTFNAKRRQKRQARRDAHLEQRRQYEAANPDVIHGQRRRRRARRAQVVAVSYDRTRIFERDDWTCHLCGETIPKDVKRNDRLEGTLDHVVPISVGGADHPENVRAAHRGCNSSKGARI